MSAIGARGVVDDRLARGSDVLGIPVLGNRDDLASVRRDGIGLASTPSAASPTWRHVSRCLKRSPPWVFLPALVHPTASSRPGSDLAKAQILAHSYVGSDAVVGKGVIVNTGAVVSHDCVLQDLDLCPGRLRRGDHGG